jgi:dolichol-phosphate mannosyltransferase
METVKLTIIIPVYNEENLITEVLQRVLATPLEGLDREIIVVDDGSTDATLRIVQQIAQEHPLIRLYASPINFGKGAAVRIGFDQATGDLLLIQDADLELDPAEYRHLLKPLLSGEADVVYGSRFCPPPQDISLTYLWGNRFLVCITNLLYKLHLTDMETAYKLFRAEVVHRLRLRCVGFDIEPEITAKVAKAGHSIAEIPISYHPRSSQEGKKISWRDGVDALYTLLKYRFVD